jgi:hypothetical protein
MSEARQNQRSQQSIDNPAGKPEQRAPSDESGKDSGTGIGSSQGQDRESRRDSDVPRTGRGTADIERSSAEGQGSTESLTDDPVGAYKPRP